MRTNKHATTVESLDPSRSSWSEILEAQTSDLPRLRRGVLESASVPLNPDVVSAAGFRREPDSLLLVNLEKDADGSMRFVAADGSLVASPRPDGGLDRQAFDALHRHAGVIVEAAQAAGPSQLVRLAAQLILAGVPSVAPDLPLLVRRALGERISTLLCELTPKDMSAPERRTEWSMRARRAGFRAFTSIHAVEDTQRVTALIVGTDGDVSALVRDLRAQSWPVDDIVLVVDDPTSTVVERPSGVRDVLEGPLSSSDLDALSPLVLVVDARHRVDSDLVADLALAQVVHRNGVTKVADVGTYLASVDVTSFSRTPDQPDSPALYARAELVASSSRGERVRNPAPALAPSFQAVEVVPATALQRSVERVLRGESRQIPGPLWPGLRTTPVRPSYFSA